MINICSTFYSAVYCISPVVDTSHPQPYKGGVDMTNQSPVSLPNLLHNNKWPSDSFSQTRMAGVFAHGKSDSRKISTYLIEKYDMATQDWQMTNELTELKKSIILYNR